MIFIRPCLNKLFHNWLHSQCCQSVSVKLFLFTFRKGKNFHREIQRLMIDGLDALCPGCSSVLILTRGPLLCRDSIKTVKLGMCIYFFPLCAQLAFFSFLPWEMNLGGGAVVDWDYRPQCSKPREETCCTTGYRKTANRRPVIRIYSEMVRSLWRETSAENTSAMLWL